jgi:uncharacterized protein (TIGR03067 family)
MRLALNALIGCAVLAGIAAASDQETLQGNWKRILAVHDGKPITGTAVEAKLTIEGNRFTMTEGDVTRAGTFTLNETSKPPSLDLTYDQGPEQGKTAAGIYDVRAGNRQRVCINPAGKRPAKFEARTGSGNLLEEWIRLK